MRALNEIAADIRDLLIPEFQTVRVTTVQTSEQMLQEIKTINPEKLPGVIIVFDRFAMTDMGAMRESNFTLCLIDRFKADSDERAFAVLTAGETLNALFPGSGRRMNGVSYYPVDCMAATPDPKFACLALGVVAKQGI